MTRAHCKSHINAVVYGAIVFARNHTPVFGAARFTHDLKSWGNLERHVQHGFERSLNPAGSNAGLTFSFPEDICEFRVEKGPEREF